MRESFLAAEIDASRHEPERSTESTSPPAPERTHIYANRFLADLSLLWTACLWGINIPVVKHVIGQLDGWVFNALRLTLAMLTLGICTWLEGRIRPSSQRRIDWWQVIVFALISSLFYQLMFMKGITLTTAGNTALIMASMPMWTAVLNLVLVQERLQVITWLGLIVTFLGTVIVTVQDGKVSFSSEFLVGNLYILCASIAWAVGTVMSRPMLDSITPLRLAFYSSLICLPFHFLIAGAEVGRAWPTATQPSNLIAILFSGIFSTGFAYAAWHYGVRQLGASHAAVYQNAVTLVAVLGGWLWVGEQPLLSQIFGGALIIAGLFLMRKGR